MPDEQNEEPEGEGLPDELMIRHMALDFALRGTGLATSGEKDAARITKDAEVYYQFLTQKK